MEVTFPQFLAPLDPYNFPVQRCSVSRQRASKRILIIKIGALGDVLTGTPLLAALRQAHPNAYLTWLVEHTNREAIDANPFVDEFISWNSHYWTNLLASRWKNMLTRQRFLGIPWLANAMKMRRELRKRRFDVLISFHPEQWPTLTHNAGQRRAIGIFESTPPPRWGSPQNAHLYTDIYVGADLLMHRTDKYLLPLRALGLPVPTDKQMTLGFTQQDAEAAQAFLTSQGASAAPLVVMAPMTTWASKCWPLENFVSLGDALTSDLGCRVVLISTQNEREVTEQVAGRMQVRPLVAAGTLRFREMAALLARASLVVSGDTGPMHAAAAVGTPYLALFGSTKREELAPLAGRGVALAHSVPCGPCGLMQCHKTGNDHLRCLRLITVQEALEAAQALLGMGAPGDAAVQRPIPNVHTDQHCDTRL